MAKIPLSDRPSYVEIPAEASALSRDLGRLLAKHGLLGAVLVSFKGERVGTCSSGKGCRFGGAMEKLADRILAAIDDGQFDP